MRQLLLVSIILLISTCSNKSTLKSYDKNNLVFNELATTWDEGIPLGNAKVGCLVWQNNGRLRFSLDRSDLWDLRPMENIDFNKWKFKDVYEFWKTDNYNEVQKAFDIPYSTLPAPSKILGGALEFNIDILGSVKKVSLEVDKAICSIEWNNGAKMTAFVHANKPLGWYKFENVPKGIDINLISPNYNQKGNRQNIDQSMGDLDQLGYEQGEITKNGNSLTYNQKGWGEFTYQIHTKWEQDNDMLIGVWSISTENKNWPIRDSAIEVVSNEINKGLKSSLKEHTSWWDDYWAKSYIEIPDTLLEKQYYLEMYKFGASARDDAPPISLQSVWTADNGKLPPWKGDFHHDLNTQLSYWPSYAGNHLNLEEGFLNWLWQHRNVFKKYTKDFFEVDGLNVPGVTTLEGDPMGGWIQYSFGQTVSAWLAHHFYLHWKFSMDREFLEDRAYPWIKDVAVFLDEISSKSSNGQRKLLISSSPEIYDNSSKAWFSETTNYDLSLIRWTYEKAEELALELKKNDEAIKWKEILSEWPNLDVDDKTGLTFAPGIPYFESHRHFSHLMGFHPLALIDFSDGEDNREVILNTLRSLEDKGPSAWTGYSYSWLGNLYARAFEGDKAAEALRIFTNCFCLKNSFHVNGDQCKKGYSGFTYRPFTLEGNFAFASAIQEMLIQSHTGVIHVFPSIPAYWEDTRFENLRTVGAFLVSAKMEKRNVTSITVKSEKGGKLFLQNPFKDSHFSSSSSFNMEDDIIIMDLQKGETVHFNLSNN